MSCKNTNCKLTDRNHSGPCAIEMRNDIKNITDNSQTFVINYNTTINNNIIVNGTYHFPTTTQGPFLTNKNPFDMFLKN